MLPTLPRQVRRASVPLMLRGYATCFKPSPGASRTGAFVLSTAGTKPGASDKGASAAPRAQGVSCGQPPLPVKREFAPYRTQGKKAKQQRACSVETARTQEQGQLQVNGVDLKKGGAECTARRFEPSRKQVTFGRHKKRTRYRRPRPIVSCRARHEAPRPGPGRPARGKTFTAMDGAACMAGFPPGLGQRKANGAPLPTGNVPSGSAG